MSMNLKASFVEFLNLKYPRLSHDLLNATISDQLLSPFQISLSAKTIQTLKDEIKNYWKLRQWGVKNLDSAFEKYDLRKANNFGVCMSYDFHLSIDEQPELIEINTNASFLALGLEMYEFLKIPNSAAIFNEQSLIDMFKAESKLASGRNETQIAIMDEAPDQQRLYLEFLIYDSLFKKHQMKSQIVDLSNLDQLKLDLLRTSTLIYNRYTDFYLLEEKSKKLKELYNLNQVQLSPNPYEYFLLADKERFIDWSKQTEIEKPQSLLPTYDLGLEDKEKIWTERKNLFFKPKNSFGSKQAYKGSSISRKVFGEVTDSNFIAQRISNAPEVEVEYQKQKIKFRYDLRCYAYKDELQLIIARLYQGQTTNLRTAGGGFACVVLKN